MKMMTPKVPETSISEQNIENAIGYKLLSIQERNGSCIKLCHIVTCFVRYLFAKNCQLYQNLQY